MQSTLRPFVSASRFMLTFAAAAAPLAGCGGSAATTSDMQMLAGGPEMLPGAETSTNAAPSTPSETTPATSMGGGAESTSPSSSPAGAAPEDATTTNGGATMEASSPPTNPVGAQQTTTTETTQPTAETTEESAPGPSGETATPEEGTPGEPQGGQMILTDAQRAEIDAQGWVAVDLEPVDCSDIEMAVVAVAYDDDFSTERNSAPKDHPLMMDYGSVVRRIDTYLTLRASDGHMHELIFPDAALVALLEGTSLVTRTTTPAIDATDPHGHVVTIHSCGDATTQ